VTGALIVWLAVCINVTSIAYMWLQARRYSQLADLWLGICVLAWAMRQPTGFTEWMLAVERSTRQDDG
jgi:hypothetical protein